MPLYNDPATLTPEGQLIYNAIHAEGAKSIKIALRWGTPIVAEFDAEKVLFEVYDAEETTFTPTVYPPNGYVDLLINNINQKRFEILPEEPYVEGQQVTVAALAINTILSQFNAWMLENYEFLVDKLSP